MDEDWGPGAAADSAEPFDQALIGGAFEDLIFGDHPHSRQDNNVYVRTKSGEVIDFDGHRPLIDFSFKSENYVKRSELSGDEVRKGGRGEIKFNLRIVYGFFFRDPFQALLNAHHLATKLLDHPISWWRSEAIAALPGTKVWYMETPGVVKSWSGENGSVILEADNEQKSFPKPVWWDEGFDGPAADRSLVEVDVLSGDIWWWRDHDVKSKVRKSMAARRWLGDSRHRRVSEIG